MSWGFQEIKDLIVAVGGLGGLAVLVTALVERRNKRALAMKSEADYADQISQTAVALLEPYKRQVEALGERVDRQEKDIARLQWTLRRYARRVTYLMSGIDALVRQISNDLRATPCWTPHDWHPDMDVDVEVEDDGAALSG